MRFAQTLVFLLLLSFGPGDGWTSPAVASAQRPDRVERARVLYEEGQAAYAAGEFASAAEKMEAAYRLTRAPALAYNIGRVYERMSEYDRAIRYFRIYLRSRDIPEAERTDLTARISALRAAKARAREQVFTAPPSTDELTAEARTFFQTGVRMYQRRHYDAAMQAFAAARRFHELPEIYYNMAMTAQRLGHIQDAIDYFNEYLECAGDNPPDRAFVEREIARLRTLR